MTETVDQAQTRPPRALAGIIEDAWRATGGHCCADSPGWACSFSGTGPHGLHWPLRAGRPLAASSYGTGGTRRVWPPHRLRNTAHRSPADPTTCVMRASPPGALPPARQAVWVVVDVERWGSGRCLTVALSVPLLAARWRQVAFWGRGPTGALS
jgi:hypothetical protein